MGIGDWDWELGLVNYIFLQKMHEGLINSKYLPFKLSKELITFLIIK